MFRNLEGLLENLEQSNLRGKNVCKLFQRMEEKKSIHLFKGYLSYSHSGLVLCKESVIGPIFLPSWNSYESLEGSIPQGGFCLTLVHAANRKSGLSMASLGINSIC